MKQKIITDHLGRPIAGQGGESTRIERGKCIALAGGRFVIQSIGSHFMILRLLPGACHHMKVGEKIKVGMLLFRVHSIGKKEVMLRVADKGNG